LIFSERAIWMEERPAGLELLTQPIFVSAK
jgi:hypothetical protein